MAQSARKGPYARIVLVSCCVLFAVGLIAAACSAGGKSDSLTREGTLRPAPPTGVAIEPASTPRPAPTQQPSPVPTATATPLPTPVSQVMAITEPTVALPTAVPFDGRHVEIIFLPETAQRGETVTLVARTPPSRRCTATLDGTSDAPGNALGLGTRQSDPNGLNTWSWRVPGDAKTGSNRVTVSCGGLKASTSIRVSPP
jgi:hypothetical protein